MPLHALLGPCLALACRVGPCHGIPCLALCHAHGPWPMCLACVPWCLACVPWCLAAPMSSAHGACQPMVPAPMSSAHGASAAPMSSAHGASAHGACLRAAPMSSAHGACLRAAPIVRAASSAHEQRPWCLRAASSAHEQRPCLTIFFLPRFVQRLSIVWPSGNPTIITYMCHARIHSECESLGT